MFNWDDLRYFLVLSRVGTLSAAGGELMLDPTTVGRRLVKLEEQIGVQLFKKARGRYVPTEGGMLLLPWAERMEREAFGAEREVVGGDQRREGVVKLAATEMLATRFIARHLPRFSELCPDIELDLICTNGDVSLARREADIALQLSRPKHDELIIKKLASIDLGAYASSTYVERHGFPSEIPNGHRLILFANKHPFLSENSWIQSRIVGAGVSARADCVSALYSAAVAGSGIALLPCLVADLDPRLVGIPLEGSPEPRQIWQAVHADLKKTARVRAVLDFLAEIFAPGQPLFQRPRLVRSVASQSHQA